MPSTEQPLGDLFLRTSRAVRRRWVASLAPWDLAPHHARALRLIGEHEAIRPGVLAEHLRIAPRSVTDVVDALAERGFVRREADPGDRRATVLHLTDAGREVRDAIDASRREETEGYFAGLSERDRASLGRILRRLDASEPRDGGH